MSSLRLSVLVCLAAPFLAAASCSNREPAMSASTATATVFSAFTARSGGFSEAIAPGSPLVTLGRGAGATWWESDAEVTAALPPGTPVDGARWNADGRALYLGLGVLEVGARAWRALPALAAWNQAGPRGELPVREAAWTPSGRHVALLLETRGADGASRREVAVVSAADGAARGRRVVDGAAALVASDDRVLVAGASLLVLDLDAKLIAEPSPAPTSVFRVREASGRFAAVGVGGEVALIEPRDGAVLATWEGHASDALPLPRGLLTIDEEGVVRASCLDHGKLRQVAEFATGVRNAVLQLAGDQLAIAGAGATPVHVARFADPCR